MLIAKDLMTGHVLTVSPNMGLRELVEFLRENAIHAAPVKEGERIVGLVSLTDVMGYLADEAADVEHNFSRLFLPDPEQEGYEEFTSRLDGATVNEVMTPSVFTCEIDSSAGEVAELMIAKQIHRVVVTHDGSAVGLLSATDLLRAVSRYEKELAAASAEA